MKILTITGGRGSRVDRRRLRIPSVKASAVWIVVLVVPHGEGLSLQSRRQLETDSVAQAEMYLSWSLEKEIGSWQAPDVPRVEIGSGGGAAGIGSEVRMQQGDG